MFTQTLKDRLKNAVHTLPLDPQRLQSLLTEINNRKIPNNDYLNVISLIELIAIDYIIGNHIEDVSITNRQETLRRWELLKKLYDDCMKKHFENKPEDQAKNELATMQKKLNEYIELSIEFHIQRAAKDLQENFRPHPSTNR